MPRADLPRVAKRANVSALVRVASIGASIGLAFAQKGESLEQLMKRADRALYEAKAAGRGTFRFSTVGTAETAAAADGVCGSSEHDLVLP